LRDATWNFTAALIDAAGWGLGMALIAHDTILPLFVSQLTPSDLALGAIPAVLYFGWYLPGVLVAAAIERLARLKTCVLAIALFERLVLLTLVMLVVWLGPDNRSALLRAFFASWFVMNLATGCATPAYFKLVAKTVPPGSRGRLYGIGGGLAGLLGAVGGLVAERLLKEFAFPYGFAWCFAVAFIVLTLSVLPLAWMREPETPLPAPAPRGRWHAGHLLQVAGDPRLLRLVVSHTLSCGILMAAAFYTPFAQRELGADAGAIARYTAALMAAGAAGNLLCGWVGDRHGNRRALLVASFAGVVAAWLALVAPSLAGMYGVFALSRVAAAGWSICWVNYVLELSPPHRTASYIAVASLMFGPARILLPLIGAPVVSQFGYQTLFAAGGIMTAGSVALLLVWVPEPRARNVDAAADQERPGIGGGREDDGAEVRAE
jgi:MFS family permease